MNFKILQGDSEQILKTFADNSIDAIVTDPPYQLNFLGKDWDKSVGSLGLYKECLRVLKPGGHILAFSAARTYHHLAITLEQAGFEIRDQIMWIYSSGFPKSQSVGRSIQRSLGVKETKASKGMNAYAEVKDKKGREKWMNPGNITTEDYPEKNPEVVCTDPEAKAWEGWGTALKPAHEPICMARKPLKQSIAKNVQEWGTGALNIDATRVPIQGQDTRSGGSNGVSRLTFGEGITSNEDSFVGYEPNEAGRFPSNVIGEIPDYQKFYYCPKVSRTERHIGFEDPGPMFQGDRFDVYMPTAGKTDPNKQISAVEKKVEGKGNNHPTVKPVALMKYLIKLITPKGGTVLDPFNGSGSTGMAAVELGHPYIGCELDPNYVEISEKRIRSWYELTKPNNTYNEMFEE